MPHPFIAGVAYTMKMLLKILLALLLCSHRTTVANSDSCEKTQCRLVPQTNDLSTTFSTTASERGVRLFYLYVKVNNNTYRPTNPSNKLRPARWAWARDIQEPMLSFSYDYDILSWGLLHHFQVRMMRVWLLDQPSGCLSNLSLPCQDRVIARALLMDVTNDYFLEEKSQKRATVGKPFVVCNIVLDEHDNEWSKLFDGNLVYRCCSNSTKRVGNETSVECGLHVRVSDWLHFFYHVINYTTIPMLFFWPAIILVLPDFLFTFEDKEDAEKAPKKTGKEDTSQTQKSENSRTNAKHHSEGLEESFPLLSRSETEGSYGTIVQEPCIEGNVSCFKKCLKKIICCEKTEAPPPQPPPDLGQEREKVTLGETSTPSTSDQSDAVRSLIPVDDVSPITIRRLMRYCTRKSSVICSDYSKLVFLYYILFFIIYYYKLLFSLLYKDRDLKRAIKIPGARFEGKLYEWFDMTTVYFDLRVLIIILFVAVLIFLPLILIFYIKPCDLQAPCSKCEKNPFYLRTDIREHLQTAPHEMFSMVKDFSFSTWDCLEKFGCSKLVLGPSVRCFRCSTYRWKKRRCVLLKVFFMCLNGLLCSILLIVSFILFWGVVLALFWIPTYLILFAVTAIITLFRYSPFSRLFLFAWHVVRQFNTGDPSERIPCLSCACKGFKKWCKQCLWRCKTDNERRAAAGNGNTHEQENDSTESIKLTTSQENQSKTGKLPVFELRDKNSEASGMSFKEAANADDNFAGEGTSIKTDNNLPNVSLPQSEDAGINENKQCSYFCQQCCYFCKHIFLRVCSFVLASGWALGVTVIACLSCRFVARMVGFVIVGLYWNSKETIPYLTFLVVLMHHIYCCYSSIQSRYKEIKVMISKQLRSQDCRGKICKDGTIPLDLFWFVCNERKVLPLVDEVCLMFVSVVAFGCVLFLAVAAIMFLGEENSAFPDLIIASLQAGAILISSKFSDWVFKKLIKEERFVDDEKIKKQEMVEQAFTAWCEQT